MQRIIHGHFWTIAPVLKQLVRPARPSPSSVLAVQVDDSPAGPVRVFGKIHHRSAAKTLLVIIHGLGGNSESHYVVETAARAERLGLACLRLNMRGAGNDGADIYHPGLHSDVHAAISSPELGGYERVLILGYSLGGHIALRYVASGSLDPRVRAVAAVCAPIDLDRAVTAIDRPERWVYRRFILAGLKDMYKAAAARRAMPLPVRDALAIGTMREWDRRIMTRRFGYPSAEAYYRSESVAPRLRDVAVPALFIAAEADPMVPHDTVRPALDAYPLSPLLQVRWLPLGGHIGFPRGVSLDHGTVPDIESQIIQWLQRH